MSLNKVNLFDTAIFLVEARGELLYIKLKRKSSCTDKGVSSPPITNDVNNGN